MPKAWVKKGKNYLFILRIHGFTLLIYFLFFDAGFKFGEAFSVAENTEDKITSFLSLSIDSRSFKFECPKLQESSSTTTSMDTGKDPS